MRIDTLFLLLMIICIICFPTTFLKSQCVTDPGVIHTTSDNKISIDLIAEKAAPMLWFSPDEPRLYNEEGKIQIPEAFPFDQEMDKPVVYYKIRKVYTEQKRIRLLSGATTSNRSTFFDLSKMAALEIEYYFYYKEETGLGGHPHDLESTQIQIQIIHTPHCPLYKYALVAKRVIARAHGLYWFENALNVDAQTCFPISILVEEGKHANCTDKNADGVYTPGFDVTEKVNDAWGVRDIISTGKLFSGGFQGWMAKERSPKSLLLPPNAHQSVSYIKIQERYPGIRINNEYALLPFPKIPEDFSDKKLKKMVKSKKPEDWPEIATSIQANRSIVRLSKENKLRNKIGISYRFDEDNSISFALPLLLVKHVEAPMTGGWFYHKFYLGNKDSSPDQIARSFGHQIQHTNSASRWLDNYIGIGYEFVDIDEEVGQIDHHPFLVTEIGMKIRVNITKTPLKFLKFLGTDYWGVRFGWKNLGFNPFYYSGFVLEFGAGAF